MYTEHTKAIAFVPDGHEKDKHFNFKYIPSLWRQKERGRRKENEKTSNQEHFIFLSVSQLNFIFHSNDVMLIIFISRARWAK